MKGHYSPNNSWTNEVWGLHVDGDLAFTCSDDATLRCWSIPKKKLLSIASLNLSGNSKFWNAQAKNDKTNDF
jgi:microtubule-associated protein-like 6